LYSSTACRRRTGGPLRFPATKGVAVCRRAFELGIAAKNQKVSRKVRRVRLKRGGPLGGVGTRSARSRSINGDLPEKAVSSSSKKQACQKQGEHSSTTWGGSTLSRMEPHRRRL